MPPAVGVSAITATTLAGMRPERQASAIATMLLPWPEIRTARRASGASALDDDTVVPGTDRADQRGGFTGGPQPSQRGVGMRSRYHHHHADAAVEGTVHLG